MKVTPIAAYKYFTETEVRSKLDEWNAADDDDLKEELDSLHLLELELTEVTKNLDNEYFYQTDDWVWYAEEFIDPSTGRAYPEEKKSFVLISGENGVTYKYFPGSDEQAVKATKEDVARPLKHPIDNSSFRVIFFLHFYDPNEPIHTPSGSVSMPHPQPLPERLRWKEYTHWD